MTPAQWDEVMQRPWRQRLAAVETAARAFLEDSPWAQYSTTELVEALYPAEHARGDAALHARRRIFDALKTERLPTHGLADCCHRGPMRKTAFGTHRPWIWHAPTGEANPEAVRSRTYHTCPHCGGQL